MTRTYGKSWLSSLVIVATVLCALCVVLVATANAGTRPPLRVGDHSSRVCALQWELSGGKPSAYRGIRTLSRKDVDCKFGPKTATGVWKFKRRLGFPSRALKSRGNVIAGQDFIRILEGKTKRPLGYLIRAQKRYPVIVPTPEPTACVNRLLSYAKGELGVTEHPFGNNSNSGIRVHFYQSSTGAYNQAWCLSFALKMIDLADPGNHLAHYAGVYGETDWVRAQHETRLAHAAGILRALPRVGSLVLWQDWRRRGGGHAGIVVAVGKGSGPGWFVSIEGNSGDAVREHYHNLIDRQPLFVWITGCQ